MRLRMRVLQSVLAALVLWTTGPAYPRPAQVPSESTVVGEKLGALKPLMAELQRAVQDGNVSAVLRTVDEMQRIVGPLRHLDDPRPKLLEILEKSIQEPIQRERYVGFTAFTAEEVGEYVRARAYAEEALNTTSATTQPQNKYFGNHVLGLLAFRRGDIAAARAYLLASAGSPPWPGIARSGPSLKLAQMLLNKGDRETVLDFLEKSKRMWPQGEKQLISWQAIIRAGVEPNWSEWRLTPSP